MEDYLLVLKFENAGIFKKIKRLKDKNDPNSIKIFKNDRIFENKNRFERDSSKWIEPFFDTIHCSFIENVLMVLAGKRPVSKYRKSCTEKDVIIEAIAKKALVKIDTAILNTKKGDEYFQSEKITTTKCMSNSWNNATPSWIRMKYLLTEDLYKELLNLASEVCGTQNPERELFSKISDELYCSKDPRVDSFIKKISGEKCEPLVKLLTGGKVHSLQQAGYRGLGTWFKTMVTKGIADISRIDGSICIPVSKEELELFSNGNGVCTLFEGGLVSIDSVIDLEYTSKDVHITDFKECNQ